MSKKSRGKSGSPNGIAAENDKEQSASGPAQPEEGQLRDSRPILEEDQGEGLDVEQRWKVTERTQATYI